MTIVLHVQKEIIVKSSNIGISKIADKIGIEFFCSAFYPEAVTFLESINVKTYKIASRTCLFTDPFSSEKFNISSI